MTQPNLIFVVFVIQYSAVNLGKRNRHNLKEAWFTMPPFLWNVEEA